MRLGLLPTLPTLPTLATLAFSLLGCSNNAPIDPNMDQHDGPDDSFLIGGKADAYGISEDSPIACAIRRVVNESDETTLTRDVNLVSGAARNIVKYREGPDGVLGTRDDGWFGDLKTLDSVRWVGPVAFERLKVFVEEHGEFACGEVDVQILSFNDFHGHLQPPSGFPGMVFTDTSRVPAGGVAYLATHIANRTKENPNTLIVSAGDLIGGSPLLSSMFHDEPTIESMNLIGLSIAAVGNHEFDRGMGELLRMQHGGCHPIEGCAHGSFGGAQFDFLAANVVVDATGDTLFPPYSIRNFRGARIGFIGLTTRNTPSVTTPEGSEGISFLREVDTINAIVEDLVAQKIQTIVVLLHEGGTVSGHFNECVSPSGPLFDIVEGLRPEVDIVLGGHTHSGHLCWFDGRLVASAASFGRLLTDIDLRIDERTGEVVSLKARNEIVTRRVEADVQQMALIERYEALAAPIANRVVGEITENITRATSGGGDSRLGSMVSDAQREWTGADLALMNPGGLRADLLAAQRSAGEPWGAITYGEAFAVHPFGNAVVTMVLTGAQILAVLEQQWVDAEGNERRYMLSVSDGFTYTWDPERPIGQRIVPGSAMLHGVVLHPGQSYFVTINNFLALGGDGFSLFAQETAFEAHGKDLDALLAYLEKNSPVSPPTKGRINRL